MTVPWALLSGGHGAAAAGAAAFALQAPVVLGLLLGGRCIRRFGSRRALLLSDLAAAILAAVALGITMLLPGTGLAAVIPVVAALALANLCGQPGTVAQEARVPELARLAGLPIERATGLREIAVNVGLVGGPALGVLLADAFGLSGALTVAAVLLAAIALVDALFFPPFQARTPTAAPEAARVSVLGHPTLRDLTVIGCLLVGVYAAMDEIIAPSLVLAAGLSAGTLALFLGLAGGAAMVGGGLFALFGDRLDHRRTFIGGIALMATGLVLLALLPPAAALVAAPILIGLGAGPLSPIVVTRIHRAVPSDQRAGILGTLAAVILTAQPVAAITAGPLVDAIGATAVTVAVAALVLVALVLAVLSPGIGRMSRTA